MGESLEHGLVEFDQIAGGVDLQLTIETGQSYLWRGEGGQLYHERPPDWYYIVLDGEFLRVRQVASGLEWESTTDGEPILRRLLRLDDDLDDIFEMIPPDRWVTAAVDKYRGMRLVQDPPFPCLISFICSTQMRVERIHAMVTNLCLEFGPTVEVDGRPFHGFPEATYLAEVSESDLRAVSLGYRAPYVLNTANMVASGELHPADVGALEYEHAREELTRFTGVGDKVADCVLLFSLGYLQAVPLDTWIQRTIAEQYPRCDMGNYRETSRAIREYFGETYAGYAQTYLFHYFRSGANERTTP